MKVDYLLQATGSIITPRIDHIIYASNDTTAIEAAKRVVEALHPTYFNFILWNTSSEKSAGHYDVAQFTAETPAPIVKVIRNA